MSIRDVFPEYDAFEKGVVVELREQRRKRDITLKEISGKLGLHSNTLSRCENHVLGLGLDVLYGYARVFDLPISAFINPHGVTNVAGPNPLAELSEDELKRYSGVLQKVFQLFNDEHLKLSGECLYEATRLVAKAVQEQRSLS